MNLKLSQILTILVLTTSTSLLVGGAIFLSIANNKNTSVQKIDDSGVKAPVEHISVHLEKDNYKGTFLRNTNSINLTEDMSKFPEFNGYTTTENYSRLLNSLELRNGDKLKINIPKNKINNWETIVQWVDTLTTKNYLTQNIDWVKKSDTQWVSKAAINYVNFLDIPRALRNNSKVCFSEKFYNSLSGDEKEDIQTRFGTGNIATLSDNSFNQQAGGTILKEFKYLNDAGWVEMGSIGVTSFLPCIQKIKEGSIEVNKINDETLELTYNAESDYSYLGKQHIYPKVEGYSYLREVNGDSTKFLTGIIFSNINTLGNYSTIDFTSLNESVRKGSGLVSKRTEENNVVKYVASNWEKTLKEEILEGKATFKSRSKSFAALYGIQQDAIPTKFWEWFNSQPIIK